MHERDKCDKIVNFRDIRNQKERFVSNQTVLDCTKKLKTHHFDQLPLPNNFFLGAMVVFLRIDATNSIK